MNDGLLYIALNIKPDATQDEIKAAYRKLAQKHHPDKEGGSETRFRVIQEAYDTLSDPARRAQYDATGKSGINKPPLRDQAMSEFAGLLSAFTNADNFDFDHTNLVENMQMAIGSKLNHLELQRAQIEAKIVRTENMKGRLTATKGHNFMFDILNNTIKEANGLLYQIKAAEAVQEEMIYILEDFQYRVDVPEPQPQPSYFTQGGGSTPWGTIFGGPTGN